MLVRGVAPPVSLGRVIAHQVDGLGPYLPPDVHVVAQIDGTAYPAAGCPHHLSVVCAHGPRAAEGTVGVALMFIRVAEVSHFIIPRLHMKCWGSISSPVCSQILSNGGQQACWSMLPQTCFSPGFCRPFQLHIPCHVLHIRSRWVHLTSQFVMEIQDALHVIVCDGSFPSLLGCPPFTILIHVLFQKFLQQSGVRNHHRWNRSGHEEQCGHSEPLRSCTHHNEWPRGFPGKISKIGSSTPFGSPV